jgi:sugar phosphate isomerase/epimerase
VEEVKHCLEAFGKIGAQWVNIHAAAHAPMHSRAFVIESNLRSLKELVVVARNNGVRLMLENTPDHFNSAHQLGELLDPLPELGLHLDIGHCNLMVVTNTTDEILRAYGPRLAHVHLHDNKGGGADLHLPLGSGNLDVSYYLGLLQSAGYDDTITLEVFTADKHYLAYSRDLLRRLWEEEATVRRATSQGTMLAQNT